jgi:tripartite-type tricarboxylate transporter receptor subunit TctC
MPSPKMETKLTIRSLIVGLIIAVTLLTSCGDTSEKEFYEGKTISVYVGRPPGSGADLAVRSFVRFWQEHIPGRPTMVVKNIPGGAGSRVWNVAWDKKEPNDLEIFFSPVSGTAVIVREEGLRAELSQLPFIGALTSPNMTFARTERLASAEDLPDVAGLKFGGQGPAHRFSVLGRLTLDILGVDYLSITGFSGSSDVFNAVRRKEVDIQTAPLNFYRFTVEPGVVKDGEVIPLWYNPIIDDKGEIVPLPAAGDIPSFIEYYESVKGEAPAGTLFEIYKWLLPNINGIVYAAFLPRNSSAEASQILSESFAGVTQDEAYRAEEKRMFGFNLPVVSAEQGAKILDDMANAPENIRLLLDEYIQQGR